MTPSTSAHFIYLSGDVRLQLSLYHLSLQIHALEIDIAIAERVQIRCSFVPPATSWVSS
jgi:hypothetical protein